MTDLFPKEPFPHGSEKSLNKAIRSISHDRKLIRRWISEGWRIFEFHLEGCFTESGDIKTKNKLIKAFKNILDINLK